MDVQSEFYASPVAFFRARASRIGALQESATRFKIQQSANRKNGVNETTKRAATWGKGGCHPTRARFNTAETFCGQHFTVVISGISAPVVAQPAPLSTIADVVAARRRPLLSVQRPSRTH